MIGYIAVVIKPQNMQNASVLLIFNRTVFMTSNNAEGVYVVNEMVSCFLLEVRETLTLGRR